MELLKSYFNSDLLSGGSFDIGIMTKFILDFQNLTL